MPRAIAARRCSPPEPPRSAVLLVTIEADLLRQIIGLYLAMDRLRD